MIMYSIMILIFWFSSLLIPFFWINNDENNPLNDKRNQHRPDSTHFMKG